MPAGTKRSIGTGHFLYILPLAPCPHTNLPCAWGAETQTAQNLRSRALHQGHSGSRGSAVPRAHKDGVLAVVDGPWGPQAQGGVRAPVLVVAHALQVLQVEPIG